MNLKNRKNLLLLGVIILIIVSVIYLANNKSSNNSGSILNFDQSDNSTLINSINIQNNVLSEFFNTVYESQISTINAKFFLKEQYQVKKEG